MNGDRHNGGLVEIYGLYYFHLSNAGDSVRDDFGEEFAREEDARTHAARVASELARHQSDGWH
jgi:hypothetical protein